MTYDPAEPAVRNVVTVNTIPQKQYKAPNRIFF
jgi:hypothetical protein